MCRPRVDLDEFTLDSMRGMTVLLDRSKTKAIVHESDVYDHVNEKGYEMRSRFKMRVVDGRRLICLDDDRTCFDMATLDKFCVNWLEVYTKPEQPLLARIVGTDWFLMLAPEIMS
ncbi:hypothetical protein [Aeropyrum globular virus 1]|uniref:hypothetical protein n=1 Tax=Aeropyrum globular virus 1 TaxID=1932713 RepID=UPI000C7ED6CD|nr:hypothetical protein C1186_gp18 [Aeropyrum globular virus 1]BBC20944.1 hypothetical protein [Aeropyrum globular virus 1]